MNYDKSDFSKEKNKAQEKIFFNKKKEKIKRDLDNYMNKEDYEDDDDLFTSFEPFTRKK